jgi:Uma2 family endonuclease
MGKAANHPPRSRPGEPAWELATLYPPQGSWSEREYLALTDSRKGIEFVSGCLEFLRMPTRTHQEILQLLWLLLTEFLRPRGGAAWVSGIRVRTGRTRIRLPDVVAMLDRRDQRAAEEVFEGADLVVEVVSGDESDRHRDLVEKRAEYADARIPEYWIVDPLERRITVLALKAGGYVEHCVAEDGAIAASAILAGFQADVTKILTRA